MLSQENHIASISLHYMYYNFVRIHPTLLVTPAIEAGLMASPTRDTALLTEASK